MKRGNENSQLRKEEVEALDEAEEGAGEEVGTFRKASSDILAGRKIVKLNRGSKPIVPENAVSAATSATFNGGGGGGSGNPFGGVNLMAAGSKPSANPFGGISLAASNSDPIKVSLNPFGSFTPQTIGGIKGSIPGAISNSDKNREEYSKKMAKLNSTFCKWMETQLKENPHSNWREGVKGYISYCENLATKYGITESDEARSVAFVVPKSPELPKISPVMTSTNPSSNTGFAFNLPKASTSSSTTVAAPVVAMIPPVTTSGSTNVLKPAETAAATTAPTINPFPAFGALGSIPVPAQSISSLAPPFKFGAVAPANGGFGATAATPQQPFKFTVPSFGFGSVPVSGSGNGSTASTDAPPAATSASASASTSTTAATNFGGFGGFNFSSAGGNNNAGFSFGGLKPLTSSNATPGTGGGGGGGTGVGDDNEDGEDEGEPILEPAKVLKNAEDTDVVVFETPCKLFRFSKEDNEWKDLGKGTVRVAHAPDSKKHRIVVRNTMGKVTLNSYIHAGMKFEVTKSAIGFVAVTGSTTMDRFNLKIRDTEVADAQKALEAARNSSS